MIESQIEQQENITVIERGNTAGTNLFHCLKDLSVPSDCIVHFKNSSDIENIFVAITGSSISNIDGLIKASGTANLFFINPNGIAFGKNYSLDVGGSFFATTASSIKFADGFEFTADSPALLLTVSVPIGLGFSSDIGKIQVKGSLAEEDKQVSQFRGVELNQLLSPVFRDVEPSGLFVKPGNTLALIGGNLILDGARLTAENGRIELGSVGKDSFVNITQQDKRWILSYDEVSLKDIQLSKGTLVDASGVTGGSIQVQGSHVRLTDGSLVVIQNLGSSKKESLKVNAAESLELSGSRVSNLRTATVGLEESDIQFISSKFKNLLNKKEFSIGRAADVIVSTKYLSLKEGSRIGSVTNNKANGGNVIINAESIDVVGVSPSNPKLYTSILSFTIANTTVDGSVIKAGKAGDINISTSFLTVQDGGQIVGSTIGSGSGGDLNIKSENLIEVASAQSLLGARAFSTGDAGKVAISTSELMVTDGGRIDTSTLGAGSAGIIILDSKSVRLNGKGKALGRVVPSSITSSANIPSKITQKYFGIPGIINGKSGDVTINAEELKITNDGELSVKNEGAGDAGILRVNVDTIILEDSSNITATSNSGKGGIIEINSAEIFVFPDSQINASSKTGIDGTVQINLPDTTN